jgi:hypothetical protein
MIGSIVKAICKIIATLFVEIKPVSRAGHEWPIGFGCRNLKPF